MGSEPWETLEPENEGTKIIHRKKVYYNKTLTCTFIKCIKLLVTLSNHPVATPNRCALLHPLCGSSTTLKAMRM